MQSTMTDPSMSNTQPRSVPAWLVVFSAALFFFYEFIQMNIFSSLDPYIMRAFQIHATDLGNLSSAYFYANLIFLFPAGLLLDRFSTRKIILSALLVCVAGTFLFSLSSNYYLAMAYRFLTGIGSAFCFLSSVRLATRWYPPKHLALVIGLIVTMAMLGGMVAQTPLTLLIENTTWRQALMIDAGLGVVILGVIYAFVVDYPPHFQCADKAEERQYQSLSGYMRSMRIAYFKKQNWLAGIYTSLMNLPIFLLGGNWGAMYLQQMHGITFQNATLITMSIFIGTIIGSPLAGALSDKLGRRRGLMLLGGVASLAIIAPLLITPHLSFNSLLALFFLLGLLTSTQVIAYPLVTESNPDTLTATSVSVISFCAIGGGAVFVPLFGRLLDMRWDHQLLNGVPVYNAESYGLAMMIMPIAFVLALGAAMLLRETYCQRQVD